LKEITVTAVSDTYKYSLTEEVLSTCYFLMIIVFISYYGTEKPFMC